MLVNLVIDMPEMPEIVGEVQIHVHRVIVLKEEIHHLYEIVRAPSAEALLEEASKALEQASKTASSTLKRPAADESSNTPAAEPELSFNSARAASSGLGTYLRQLSGSFFGRFRAQPASSMAQVAGNVEMRIVIQDNPMRQGASSSI